MTRDFDTFNPYAPPSSTAEPHSSGSDPSEAQLFLRWEKLRLLYNAILGAETAILLMVMPPKRNPGFGGQLFPLLALGFAANVCFCVGPVLNGYVLLLRFRHKAVTGVIFGVGLVLAICLTLGAIASMSGFKLN